MIKPEQLPENTVLPDNLALPSWELQDAHSGGVHDFARLMSVSKGFSLIVLQYNDSAYRDKVIPYLDRHAKAPTVVTLTGQDDVAVLEQSLSRLATDHDLIHVIGSHEWLSGEERLTRLRGLNYHREQIAQQTKAVISLWMIEDDILAFALEAPDLWAWRMGVVDFSVTKEVRHDLEVSRIDLGNADLNERKERMEALQSYLAEHPNETVTRAGLLRELGLILQQLGEPDKALDVFQEALAIYRSNDFKRDHAFVLGDISRIYVAKGDVDKASCYAAQAKRLKH
jgi:tetratricopeptide (TPR) repeat protein